MDPLWPALDQPSIELQLAGVFGRDSYPPEAILGAGLSFDVGPNGRVYVLDPTSARLVAFDSDATVAWVAGRRGEGPGEILDVARGVAVDPWKGELAILTRGGTRVDLWSDTGEFSRSVSLFADAFSDFRFVASGVLAGFTDAERLVHLQEIAGQLAQRVVVIDTREARPICSFVVEEEADLVVPAGIALGIPVAVEHGRLLAGSRVGYRIREYRPCGELIRVVERAVAYPTRPGIFIDGAQRGAGGFGSISAPLILPSGRWLVHAVWETGIGDPDGVFEARSRAMREWRRQGSVGPPPKFGRQVFESLDLFDTDGRLLTSVQWEGERDYWGNGTPEQVAAGDHVYMPTEEPFPQIRRYRVTIVEPEARVQDRRP